MLDEYLFRPGSRFAGRGERGLAPGERPDAELSPGLQAHIGSCPRCRAAWLDTTRLASALETTAARDVAREGLAPSGTGLVDCVMDAIRAGRVRNPVRRKGSVLRGVLASLALGTAAALAFAPVALLALAGALKMGRGLSEPLQAVGLLLGYTLAGLRVLGTLVLYGVSGIVCAWYAVSSVLLQLNESLVLAFLLLTLAMGLALAHLLSGSRETRLGSAG